VQTYTQTDEETIWTVILNPTDHPPASATSFIG
jgi:hypothetical protein